MDKKVVKFGGSSVADANQVKKVKDILYSEENRKYCIVSAAGKRNSNDEKITDLLISAFSYKNDDKKLNEVLNIVRDRYKSIIDGLSISFDLDTEIDNIKKKSKTVDKVDFLASRGEYLSAKIISIFVDGIFLDMENNIIFNDDNKVNYELSYQNIKKEIDNIEKDHKDSKIIIPGFYGSNKQGNIVTFSRGGSDITGALVARAMEVTVYENWTDVSGVMFEDPRLVKEAKPIEYITYSELRELSYMGASVLHEETLYPVSKACIPVHILNTNMPSDKGTMIVSSIPTNIKRHTVTGIAGKQGFTSILLHKALMNEEIGFLAKLLTIFDKERISVEHCPTGIDTISLIVRSNLLDGKIDKILNEIKNELNPDELTIENNLTVIAIVGEGLYKSKDITAKVFDIFRDEGILIRMIDYGSSGNNIIVAVSDDDYEKSMIALNSLYNV